MSYPWYYYPILLRPGQIAENLERVRAAGMVKDVPNLWQISLGVMRMWHRLMFRGETIGLAENASVRSTLRAKLLKLRWLRFPFVLAEGSVVPGDMSGLGSSPERLITHIIGTYHDGVRFAYDYQILEAYPGGPEQLLQLTRDVVDKPDKKRSKWLRDLVIFEGYHERLVGWIEAALERGVDIPEGLDGDPDISFHAYLKWCAAQPATPEDTWDAVRDGKFSFPEGLRGTYAVMGSSLAKAA